MERASTEVWREAGHWAIQVRIDGALYTGREYRSIADATHAIAQILRNHANRPEDSIDEDVCDQCSADLDLRVCSQCGIDGFVRACEHGTSPIRAMDGALYCCRCRPNDSTPPQREADR